MITKLIKILPMLAIVAGIGGAFGFSAQQDPCEEEMGYQYSGSGEPTLPPDQQANLELIPGSYGLDYDCNQAIPTTCRWVYVEDPETSELEWIQCPGQFVE